MSESVSDRLCDCNADTYEKTDSSLPPNVVIVQCKDCGLWSEYDTVRDELRGLV